MKKEKEMPTKQIVVHVCRSWSSSFSRVMSSAGRAASTAAIQQAAATGTHVSYLKNGIVVKSAPETKGLE